MIRFYLFVYYYYEYFPIASKILLNFYIVYSSHYFQNIMRKRGIIFILLLIVELHNIIAACCLLNLEKAWASRSRKTYKSFPRIFLFTDYYRARYESCSIRMEYRRGLAKYLLSDTFFRNFFFLQHCVYFFHIGIVNFVIGSHFMLQKCPRKIPATCKCLEIRVLCKIKTIEYGSSFCKIYFSSSFDWKILRQFLSKIKLKKGSEFWW